MNKNNIVMGLILGIVMLLVGAGILAWSIDRMSDDDEAKTTTESSAADSESVDNNLDNGNDDEMEDVSEPAEETVVYTHEVELPDVTGGVTIQGINTGGLSSGVAQSGYKDGRYMLYVEFDNLPEPINGSFYEGWLVQQDPLDFFSTGVVDQDENGVYIDTYTDDVDWNQSHDFYVLTLEPNDGDPAPADHIVEAVLVEL